jgi:hypothetical protein
MVIYCERIIVCYGMISVQALLCMSRHHVSSLETE